MKCGSSDCEFGILSIWDLGMRIADLKGKAQRAERIA